MISEKLKNNSFILYISVILIAIFRLLLTATIPLLDKTESRYAEIARIMQETNQWIVLQIDYGVPFWAKPPLSTWLSAGSFVVFGINEFAIGFGEEKYVYILCLNEVDNLIFSFYQTSPRLSYESRNFFYSILSTYAYKF